jgi:hypothetical protein
MQKTVAIGYENGFQAVLYRGVVLAFRNGFLFKGNCISKTVVLGNLLRTVFEFSHWERFSTVEAKTVAIRSF